MSKTQTADVPFNVPTSYE